jgi:hypothetical protein
MQGSELTVLQQEVLDAANKCRSGMQVQVQNLRGPTEVKEWLSFGGLRSGYVTVQKQHRPGKLIHRATYRAKLCELARNRAGWLDTINTV